MSLPEEIDHEFTFVVRHLASVLRNAETREFLFQVGEDVACGRDLLSRDTKLLSASEQIEAIVKVSLAATLMRAIMVMVKSDRTLSPEELQFLRVTSPGLLSILKAANLDIPDRIESRSDFDRLDEILESGSDSLFGTNGLGGRLSSLPRLSALCAPFTPVPLLPVVIYMIRYVCSHVAALDGVDQRESRVIDDFDNLTDSCEQLSRRVSEAIPKCTSFNAGLDHGNSVGELQSTESELEREATRRLNFLKRSTRQLARVQRRLENNQRRQAVYFKDVSGLVLTGIAVAVVILMVGLGFITGGLVGRPLIGIVTGSILSPLVVSTTAKRLLNVTWHSNEELSTRIGALYRMRYQTWRELKSADAELARIAPIIASKIEDAEKKERERRRQEDEERRRRLVLSSYDPQTSGYGPILVRGYFRKDGTYVRPHQRRR